ncbi:Lysosomal protective protein, partial [Trichoplax sp. H2]
MDNSATGNQPSLDAQFRTVLTKRAIANLVKDRLPGQIQDLNARQFSGYVRGADSNRLHYMFYECESNPNDVSLILWMNGGPGCSSMAGLLLEIGPFSLTKDFTLTLRDTSWHKFVNTIFLESPGGTSYSYNQYHQYNFSDNTVTDSNYLAMLDFYKIFPQFIKNSLYITGESYGGFYAPLLARQYQVRQALHIPSVAPQWQICSNFIDGKYSYAIQYESMNSVYNYILPKLRLLAVYGDLDALVAFGGGLRYFRAGHLIPNDKPNLSFKV